MSQGGCERRGVKTNPSRKIGVQHLLQGLSNRWVTTSEVEYTPVGKKIKIPGASLIPKVGPFALHPCAVEAKRAQHLHEDRVHMVFVKLEVFPTSLGNYGVDINWHNL